MIVQLPKWLKKSKGSHDWRIYEIRSRLLTTIFKPKWFGHYDTSRFHIDHKFSILQGFRNNVPLRIINNRGNLALTAKSYNLRKGSRCDITLSELYQSAIPDDKLSQMIAFICRVDNEDLLLHWGLLAHNRNKAMI